MIPVTVTRRVRSNRRESKRCDRPTGRCEVAQREPLPVGAIAYQEAQMLQWKRTILNTGVTLTKIAAGALAVEGVASAHDGAGSDGVIPHAVGKVTTLGTGSFIITTHDGTTETI